jgi:hypothetical protein
MWWWFTLLGWHPIQPKPGLWSISLRSHENLWSHAPAFQNYCRSFNQWFQASLIWKLWSKPYTLTNQGLSRYRKNLYKFNNFCSIGLKIVKLKLAHGLVKGFLAIQRKAKPGSKRIFQNISKTCFYFTFTKTIVIFFGEISFGVKISVCLLY